MPSGYAPLGINDGSAVEDALCYHLYELAQSMKSIVEVGSFYGKSTHALLSGCRGAVYAVDHFRGSTDTGDATFGKNGRETFLTNCGKFANLKLIEMYSHEAAAQFEDNSIDMIFIDAGHLYDEFSLDFKSWYPKARILICGHDYCHVGVRKALDESGLNVESPLGNYWEHFKNAKP